MTEMNYLDLHGERVAYREAGAGDTLLLIHGMAESSATWRAVIHYRADLSTFFGMDLARLLPYNLVRT